MSRHTILIHICMISVFSLLFMGCAAAPLENIQSQNTNQETELPIEASANVSVAASPKTSAEVPAAALSDESVSYYLAAEQAGAYPAPCLTLYHNGQFSFTYDVLSSYYPYGTYEIKDRLLTATTSDKKYQYIFTQADDGTLKFVQKGSSEIELTDKNIGNTITDGAAFVKINSPGSEGSASMTGLCLISDDGKYLIVDENGIPIVMSNQSDSDTLFSTLQTGDKIEITYEAIQETYPGQTGVYTCKLIKKNSTDVIPESTLSRLNQLGWLFPIKCE